MMNKKKKIIMGILADLEGLDKVDLIEEVKTDLTNMDMEAKVFYAEEPMQEATIRNGRLRRLVSLPYGSIEWRESRTRVLLQVDEVIVVNADKELSDVLKEDIAILKEHNIPITYLYGDPETGEPEETEKEIIKVTVKQTPECNVYSITTDDSVELEEKKIITYLNNIVKPENKFPNKLYPDKLDNWSDDMFSKFFHEYETSDPIIPK